MVLLFIVRVNVVLLPIGDPPELLVYHRMAFPPLPGLAESVTSPGPQWLSAITEGASGGTALVAWLTPIEAVFPEFTTMTTDPFRTAPELLFAVILKRFLLIKVAELTQPGIF